jgi:hypothetical protein
MPGLKNDRFNDASRQCAIFITETTDRISIQLGTECLHGQWK